MSDSTSSGIPLDASPNPTRGSMSASANAAAQKNGYINNYYITPCSKDNFFDAGTAITTSDVNLSSFGSENMDIFNALTKNDETKEAQYRNFFYSILVTHKNHSNLIQIVPDQKTAVLYEEAQMKTLIPVIYDLTKEIFGILSEDSLTSKASSRKRKGDENEVQKVEHALLINNDSLPDLVVVQKASMTIRIGEFKNAEEYSTDDAANQCFSYLCCILYHYRAVCHIPLESVYGFWFCGPQCRGLNEEYAFGLLKLSAPKNLGEKFIFEQFWGKNRVAEPEGIKLLLHYLTRGKQWDIPGKGPLHYLKKRVPALFSTPLEYWSDKLLSESNDVRELQRNATSAIVFKVDYAGMMKLFESMTNVGTGGNWFQKFVLKVRAKIQTFVEEKRYFYVKFRLSETSTIFKEIIINFSAIYELAIDASPGEKEKPELATDAYPEQKEKHELATDASPGKKEKHDVWQDIRNLYIVPPFKDIKNHFHCIVMADVMGHPLVLPNDVINERKMIELLFGLQSYMYQLITAELFHGDFLPHNFFYNVTENRIKVIDFDEGCASKDGPIPLRVDDEIGKKTPWSSFLRYPNALRANCEMYTKSQFAASVLQLLGRYGKTNDLEAKAKIFSSLLEKFDNEMNRASVVSDIDLIKALSDGIDSMYLCIRDILM